MTNRPGWALALILLALPVVGLSPFAAAPAQEQLLKEGDHKKLGEKIQEWISAKRAKEGVADAESEFRDELGKWEKKRQLGGADPLAATGDLGASLWYSFEYDKQRGISKGKVKDVEKEDGGPVVPYTIHAPSRYSPKTAYPLVLLVPAYGKRPFDYITEDWVLGDLRDNAILCAVHMPEDKDAWNVTRTESGDPGGIANLLLTLREVRYTYAIDFDKVFLVGRLEGLQAAMTTANSFPDLFAGVVGRTGDFQGIAPDNFRNLATFFAGGGEGATSFKEASDAAGHGNCTVSPDAKEEDIWRWISETKRNANPSEVTLVPGTPFPNGAYWLEVPPWDGEGTARVHGKIDKESNTVTIEGEGVVAVTLSFNDTLLDLSRPVKVICNGVEHEDLIPRSPKTFLDYCFSAHNDPGRIYTAVRQYDLATDG